MTQQLRVTREPLSLLSVLSLLWHGFGPWPGKFHMRWTQPGEKKKKDMHIKMCKVKKKKKKKVQSKQNTAQLPAMRELISLLYKPV